MLRTEHLWEWMTAPLITVPPHAPLDAVAALMLDHAIRHVPVLRSDLRCAGVISDLALFARGQWMDGRWVQRDAADASTVMEPVRCAAHPDDELALALTSMRQAQADHALILNDEGVPLGIFTEHDVVTLGAQLLPGTFRPVLGRALVTAQVDTPVREGLSLMLEAQVRHLVVLKGEALAGIVSARDLIVRPGEWPLSHAMPFGIVHRMERDTTLRAAAERMAHFRIGALVVMHDDAPVGIVTRTDIAEALLVVYGGEDDTEAFQGTR